MRNGDTLKEILGAVVLIVSPYVAWKIAMKVKSWWENYHGKPLIHEEIRYEDYSDSARVVWRKIVRLRQLTLREASELDINNVEIRVMKDYGIISEEAESAIKDCIKKAKLVLSAKAEEIVAVREAFDNALWTLKRALPVNKNALDQLLQ